MKKIAEYIFIKFFGVVFNGDCAIYDRYKWLNKNLVPPKEDGTLLILVVEMVGHYFWRNQKNIKK